MNPSGTPYWYSKCLPRAAISGLAASNSAHVATIAKCARRGIGSPRVTAVDLGDGRFETPGVATDWWVRGTYFEGCNCAAICPCRSIHGEPGGPSTYGICYGAVSWHVLEGQWGSTDLADLRAVLSLRFKDDVQPSTPWEVVLYVDERADEAQHDALADIFLGRAGGTPVSQYATAIGHIHAVRRAQITLEHVAPRKRIDIVGYLRIEAEDAASDEGDVRCGIPGFDHPGTELYADYLKSTDEALTWEVRGKRNASFATDFSYSSAG